MPITSGIYVITNAQQHNPVFLENPNDEEPILAHYKPVHASKQTQEQWHWHVIDLKNGCHSIQNVEHKRYANCGSRADFRDHIMGGSKEQEWLIQATSRDGEYTIGAIDNPNFWMLPTKGKETPVELSNVPNDRRCWWSFTNVETGTPVKGDAAYGAYLFALKPLPILPFSPLRLDFIIIQQMTEDSVANASRMIAGVCGPLISLGRVQWDALCVGIIEVTSVGSDIFYERSHDVVPFERLRNLGGADILWEGCDGASALPTMAIRGLRENTTKVAILNLGDTLFRQDGDATIELRNGLAEHGITLILTPIEPTWERAFSDSIAFKKLKKLSFEYRRFRQESQFSDYVVNYTKTVALPRLKKHSELRHTIRQNIPYIVEVLKGEDQHTRSAAVAAFSQLAEYAELRDTILETVPKIVEMLKGNSGEAEAAALALIKLAEHALLRDVLKTKDNSGLTPLSLATVFGHEAVVRILLAHPGINVNSGDEYGWTPLLRAAWNGHDAVARLLLAHPGIDVNAKAEDGSTPLSSAALNGHDAVARLLLAHPGIDVNAKAKDGLTPLSRAALNEHNTVARLLLAHPGIDVNAMDNDGWTPLSWAAANGHDAVARLLLAHPGIESTPRTNMAGSRFLSELPKGTTRW